MNDQTTKLIETLAAKLGTTAEYLWAVLLKQASISATISLVWLFIEVFLITSFIVIVNNKGRALKESGDQWDDLQVIQIIGLICGSVAALGFGIAALYEIQNIVIGYANPEYWALQEILKHL